MTRTGVMASSRPHKDGVGSLGVKSSGASRRLSIVVAVLMLALALVLPSGAFAASEPAAPTAGYNQTPTTPTTTKPESGTAPSKESEPAKSTTTPTTTPTTATEPAKTLPFTGFDLRWSIAIGVLLMGAGFTIVAMQRRGRSDS
jgi:hypothetical protein